MLCAVLIGHLLPVGKVLLHERVDDQLLADGVASEFPCELVLPSGFLIGGFGGEDLVVGFFELAVVVFDCVCKAGHGRRGDCEGAVLDKCGWEGCKCGRSGSKCCSGGEAAGEHV